MRNPTRWKLRVRRAGHAQVAAFNFHISQEGPEHPLSFRRAEEGHPLPLPRWWLVRIGQRFTQLPQGWNDARVRGRKRCRYHCSNCGLYCLERNVASSNYASVLLLESRWVITVNGFVFVLLKECVCVCKWNGKRKKEMEKKKSPWSTFRKLIYNDTRCIFL